VDSIMTCENKKLVKVNRSKLGLDF